MPALTFPVSSTPGRLTGEGEGRLINAYAEKAGGTVYWRRVPGLSGYATAVGQSGPRGLLDIAGTIYAGFANALVKVTPDGTVTSLGVLAGTAGVTMACNNRVTSGVSTPDLVIVREDGGAYLLDVASGALSAFPSPNLPTTVNSVSFLGGFLLFTIPDGRIFASELNSTTVNALSFATAEAARDGLVRGMVDANRFYAMGQSTTEVWANQGLTPFPLGRYPTVISVGLKTTMAVSGFEDGWDRSPLFVASDGTVRQLTGGFEAAIVSTPDVANFIAGSTISTFEASVYTARDRAVWTLSSSIGTWAYDLTSQAWHERVSVGATRWRGSRSVKSGTRWVVGDTLSAALLTVDEDARTEAGQALTWTVESAAAKGFPTRVATGPFFADFTLGLGDTATPDPKVAISWSLDGGATWRGPLQRSLGPAGQAVRPVALRSGLGLASHHGLRVRLAVTDPVDFSFMGAACPQPGPRAP